MGDDQNGSDGGAMTTMEFGVDLTCQNCVNKTESVLKNRPNTEIKDFSVNLSEQRVVLTSSLPTEDVRALIETSGKRAVLLGTGMASKGSTSRPNVSAVAMLGGLIGCSARQGVVGVVRFTSSSPQSGGCVVDGTIDGLVPGSEHALAIHESGDISQGCNSTGGHYNPRAVRHGSPQDDERHVGDLGNVRADAQGRASFKFADRLVHVNDIIGRSVVIAEGPDDGGRGNSPMSQINGNCGALLSCGIIARSAGVFENSKRICACDGVTLWDERDKPLVGPERSNLKK